MISQVYRDASKSFDRALTLEKLSEILESTCSDELKTTPIDNLGQAIAALKRINDGPR